MRAADKYKILIVDDEPSARYTLEALLIQEGYELVQASSGPEALAQLETLEPDVILLDVMMPGMSGYQVCQHLKAEARWRHIPIILVTALDGKESLARGIDAGADDFVNKPVNKLELRARVRSMLRIKRQFDELEATLQMREELANMIVHDMRNPLTTIVGYSELLLKRSTIAPQYLQSIAKISAQADRLNKFLNDMLLLAKMKAGELILNRTQVDLNQLVAETRDYHAIIAQSERVNLCLDLPEFSRQVCLDATLFQRVIDNLLSNAIKFSPPESTVTLHLEYPSPALDTLSPAPCFRLKVLDHGPGIPAEQHHRLFEAFKVIPAAQNRVSQIGLGLAFCKMVVDALEGRIYVEDNEPRGAVFVVEI